MGRFVSNHRKTEHFVMTLFDFAEQIAKNTFIDIMKTCKVLSPKTWHATPTIGICEFKTSAEWVFKGRLFSN